MDDDLHPVEELAEQVDLLFDEGRRNDGGSSARDGRPGAGGAPGGCSAD